MDGVRYIAFELDQDLLGSNSNMIHQSADLFLAVFYSAVAVFYTVLIKNRSANNDGCRMVHTGSPYNLHWWNHLVFRVMRILIWVFCVFRLFIPSIDKAALIFPLGKFEWLRLVGVAVLSLGFIAVLCGNLSLESAWRSGIDPDAPDGLKQTGLYSISRNPIYLAVFVGQVGFFLSLPSTFTLVCLIIGVISLNIQIMLEEEHLQERFKAEYTDYCRIVPRWL